MAEVRSEVEQRLGELRGGLSQGVGTIFPNVSLHPSPSFRVWHPRGPNKIEVWSWCLVDKDAPSEIKEAMRHHYQQGFSMAGLAEQDDGENWEQVTASTRGRVARRYSFNYTLGAGHEPLNEDFPGVFGNRISEHNQRRFYNYWLKLMSGQTWAELTSS